MQENNFSWTSKDLAHPGKRYQAQFIDILISIIIFFALIFLTKALGATGAITNAIIVILPSIYFVFSDALPKGQSVEKKLLKISVVSKSTGKHCSFGQAFLRNAYSPCLGIIDAALIFGKDHQRLGDLMANTIVIKNS